MDCLAGVTSFGISKDVIVYWKLLLDKALTNLNIIYNLKCEMMAGFVN